jgi:uncharacterized coiled-coil protein SlyX
MTSWRATLMDMDRRIAEAELLPSMQAEAVAALSRAGEEATDTMERLYAQMDRLSALRQERAAVWSFSQSKPGERG